MNLTQICCNLLIEGFIKVILNASNKCVQKLLILKLISYVKLLKWKEGCK